MNNKDKIIGMDPVAPDGNSTGWVMASTDTDGCHPVSIEKIRYVFKQTIGFRIEFDQYSSHFLGMVQYITPEDTIVVSLCKDGCVVPTLRGRIPFYGVCEICVENKSLGIFPDYIVSMERINKSHDYGK